MDKKGHKHIAGGKNDKTARNAKYQTSKKHGDSQYGAAKKGGAGGKFTWGAAGAIGDEVAALDKGDPNYDSSEEQ